MKDRNGQVETAPFRLHRDAWGRLVLTEPEGQQHVGVVPVRAFPISAPEDGVALCDADGHEVRWVNPEELPKELRSLLEEELRHCQFMPIVQRVVRISAATEPSEWEVETDRGATRFLLNSEDDVHRLDDHRALISDVHGVRYLIPDVRALDPTSRRLLERFL